MFVIRLTQAERATLVKLLTTKVKEIRAWRIATKSQVRNKENTQIASLLRKIALKKED